MVGLIVPGASPKSSSYLRNREGGFWAVMTRPKSKITALIMDNSFLLPYRKLGPLPPWRESEIVGLDRAIKPKEYWSVGVLDYCK